MTLRTRRQRASTAAASKQQVPHDENDKAVAATTPRDESNEEEETAHLPSSFVLDGKEYRSYQDMVDAKRKRNAEMLRRTGLLEASAEFRASTPPLSSSSSPARGPSQRGIRKRKTEPAVPLPRRKSNRIAGVKAQPRYVDDERAGKFTFGGAGKADRDEEEDEAEEVFFNGRVNDGSDLSARDAIELTGPKWCTETSAGRATRFLSEFLPASIVEEGAAAGRRSALGSPTSVVANFRGPSEEEGAVPSSLESQINNLSLDDERSVAKVTPERIYSVACHPSASRLLVCAGDKAGHLGVWNVDGESENATDDCHLFKPHSGAITHIEWNRTGSGMYSVSYDGTVRLFDVQSQTFREAFATYDASSKYKGKVGYGLDEGYRYWIQYGCLDRRSANDSLFLSTSVGNVMHVDLRSRGRLTFNERLGDKKINTVSLHPNGTTLATAGLDNCVRLWDIRHFRSPKASDDRSRPKPFATQACSKSINSAYFSPTGKQLLTTTMADNLELTENFHLQTGKVKPTKRIRHDNRTGRWLSTFMARWHPSEDFFVVGSMGRPRAVEIFDGAKGTLMRAVRGEALTAIASRCCFHPGGEDLILVGGNSSGRVTVAR